MACTEQLKNIETHDDFVMFMQNLLQDWRQHPDQWENATLEAYLEAIAAWVRDMDGYYGSRGELLPKHLTWRKVGEILLAARIYE